MATKKGKTPGTALQSWEEALRLRAQMQAKAEKATGFAKAVRFGAAGVTVDDATMEEIDVVVLAATHENQFYDTDYNANQPTSPVCYSFASVDAEDPEAEMVPHPDAERPQGTEEETEGDTAVEGASCANCWANVMGTANTGRGKACKNIRRLALMTTDALEDADSVAEAELRVAKIPVTSVANWAKYVRTKLGDEVQRPMYGVVTRIRAVPDPKVQFKVLFNFEELVNFDQALYDAVQRKVKEAEELLHSPYPKNSELAAQQPPRGRAAPARGGRPAGKTRKY